MDRSAQEFIKELAAILFIVAVIALALVGASVMHSGLSWDEVQECADDPPQDREEG